MAGITGTCSNPCGRFTGILGMIVVVGVSGDNYYAVLIPVDKEPGKAPRRAGLDAQGVPLRLQGAPGRPAKRLAPHRNQMEPGPWSRHAQRQALR